MAVNRNALWLVLAGVLAGCPPEPKPLPGGPPPEYEAPRSYDPTLDIDGKPPVNPDGTLVPQPPDPDEDATEPGPPPAVSGSAQPASTKAGVPAKPEPLPDEDEDPEE